MSTITREFTKEQLQQIIETDHVQCGEASALARIALASPECRARPVHPRITSEELDDDTLDELIDFRRSTFEYHSQQGNKVQTIIHGVTLTAMLELKELRAAMLTSAENPQSRRGSSPVIPSGWVACSERMPHIGVPVITCCGDVVQYAAYAWDGKEWQDWYEEYDKLPANIFTHWHPRPAAPQQEVK